MTKYMALAFLLATILFACSGSDQNRSDKEISVVHDYSQDDPYKKLVITPGNEVNRSWEITFHSNGELLSITEIREGRMIGTTMSFNPNGTVSEFGRVKFGRPVGKWYYFNLEGELIREKNRTPDTNQGE